MRRCTDPDHRRFTGKSGRDVCATCRYAYQKKYRKRPEVIQRRLEAARKYNARPEVKEKKAREAREKKYGISEAPKGKCQICGVKEAKAIDHDHETGVVRGFLCIYCNVRLSWMDDKAWTERANKYLHENS